MSGEGAPALAVGQAAGLRLAIVAARWHAEVAEALLAGALRAAADAGIGDPTVVRVPGSLELPVVAADLATDHDAVVVLGVVLRGGTVHFDHVCRVVADGCARVALDAGRPVGQGVLMCETIAQAWERAGRPDSAEDKGGDAVRAALATASTLRDLRAGRHRPAGDSAAPPDPAPRSVSPAGESSTVGPAKPRSVGAVP